MDKLVRKIEVPLARRAVEKVGLYLVPPEQFDRLSDLAADAYQDYPLHNWFAKGIYDPTASRIIMKTTLLSMKEDAVVYADSPDLNGFAVWLPQGFTGSKTLPFLLNGGAGLVAHCGLGIVKRLLSYELFAMKLKRTYTDHFDWYLYNLSVRKTAQGTGIARRLMAPMLAFCDDEKMRIYLETNKESNVSLYEHLGFTLGEATRIPGTTIPHYAMVYSPQ